MSELLKHYLWLAGELKLKVERAGEGWHITTNSGLLHYTDTSGLFSYIRGYAALPQIRIEEQEVSDGADSPK